MWGREIAGLVFPALFPLENLETCPTWASVSPSTQSPSCSEVALGGSYVQRPLKRYVCGR